MTDYVAREELEARTWLQLREAFLALQAGDMPAAQHILSDEWDGSNYE